MAERASGMPRVLDIPVQRFGVHHVYTLINTMWGKTGGPYARLEFWGDSGGYYSKDLFGDVDIRDYNRSTWTNNIRGLTENVYLSPGADKRLDMQSIPLPQTFLNQTLVKIRLSDWGGADMQRVFLYGLTLASDYSGGSMAQLAAGGGWKTTISLLNPGTAAATARLQFFNDSGNPLALPLAFSAGAPEHTSSLVRTLQPGAALLMETTTPEGQGTSVGWMRLNGTGNVTGFAVFRQKIGDNEQEAVVPLESRDPRTFVLLFDNTSGYATGVAIANNTSETARIGLEIRDETGRALAYPDVYLPAHGHTSFSLAEKSPAAAGIKGTVLFYKPSGGQISILGLRFNPKGSFTTIPAVPR
jgi:hypothetical protein